MNSDVRKKLKRILLIIIILLSLLVLIIANQLIGNRTVEISRKDSDVVDNINNSYLNLSGNENSDNKMDLLSLLCRVGPNTRFNKVQGEGTKLLAGNDTLYEELNYYTLTLNKGTGISSVSGAAVYLNNQTASISATPSSGYAFQNWTKTEGSTPQSTTSASTQVYMTTKTTLTANGVDNTKPVVTITKTDYGTFSWTATDEVGVVGYIINNDPAIPQASASEWTPVTSATTVTNTYDIDTTAGKTYYVWAKDAAGNVSATKSIAAYLVTRDQGNGTTLSIRIDATSATTGTPANTNTAVLTGTSVWASATANSGYHGVVLTKNGTAVTASGAAHTITAATTFKSTASPNEATITINKDDAAWSGSGINVALYQNGTVKYAYSTATVSDSTVKFSAIPNGTYQIYASKSAAGLTTLVNTGKTVTISNNNVTGTIDYYTLTKTQGANTTLTVKLDSSSGTAISTTQVLKGTTIYAAVTPASGYTASLTVGGTAFTSGNTFTINTPTEVESSAEDTTAPVVTITKTDYNTFSWTATDEVGVVGYQINNNPEAPAANASTWTTITSTTSVTNSYDIDATTAKTYYVWAKDTTGIVSAAKSITSYMVTRDQGAGTSLVTRVDGTSASNGTAVTVNTTVLNGTKVWASATANSGYHGVALTKNGATATVGGASHTINTATTFKSIASPNEVTITINKDDAAWSDSGINIALYQNGTAKYAYDTATVSGSTVKFSAIPNGTYQIYASKTSAGLTTLANTGKTVTILNNNTTGTVDYYTLRKTQGANSTLTIKLDNTSGTEISTTEVLKNTKIYGTVTPATGYTASMTRNGSAFANGGSFNITEATTIASIAADTIKPVVTITRYDYNTLSWTATDGVGVIGYQITNSSSIPDPDASSWTPITSTTSATGTHDIDADGTKSYYVWAKDAAGNVSANKSIAAYLVKRTQGEGTNLVTRVDATTANDGISISENTPVLKDTSVWASASLNTGYYDLSLTKNGTEVLVGGDKYTITAATTFKSSASSNDITIIINKDNVAWSSSKINVALYQNGIEKYAYSTATVAGTTIKFKAILNGTYQIYASRTKADVTTIIDTGKTITIADSQVTETLDYYTLTRSQGANTTLTLKLDNASGTTISTTQVLKGTTIYAAVTPASGYTASMTVGGNPFTSGNTFSFTEATTVASSAVDITKPVVTITNADYNTLSWTATDGVGITGYQVTESPTAPTADESTWTTMSPKTSKTGTYDIDSTTTKIYYVWAKDAAGNISDAKFITSYQLTRDKGVGTELVTRLDGTSATGGTSTLNDTIVLSGTSVWASASAISGYANVELTKNGVSVLASGEEHTINGDTTFKSTATISSSNKVTLLLKLDGNDATTLNGYVVNISTSSSENSASWSGITTTNSTLEISGAMVPGTEYYIWIGKDENHKTDLVYSGKSFIAKAEATSTLYFYTLTILGSDVESLQLNSSEIISGNSVIVLGGVNHAISCTIGEGYTFNSWSKVSGIASFGTSTSLSTNTIINGSNTTIKASASPSESNKVTLTLKLDGNNATTLDGYQVKISSSSTSNYSTWTGTTTTSPTLEISGGMTPGNTYYVWIGKDSNHRTNIVYSGVSFIGGTNATATINFYTLTMTGTNVDTLSVNNTSILSGHSVIVVGGIKQSITGTVNSGYVFSTWSTTEGTATFDSTTSINTKVTVNEANTTINAAAIVSDLNKVIITFRKDGVASTDFNRYRVNISTSPTDNTSSWSGENSGSSTLQINGAMVPGTTYYVWISEDSNHLGSLVYSGVSFIGAATATATVDFYTLTITRTNINVIKVNESIVGSSVVVLGNVQHTIEGTANSGYTFNAWSKISGMVSFDDATENNTNIIVSAASTIDATAVDITKPVVTITRSGYKRVKWRATDGVGVVGFQITNNPTVPSANESTWTQIPSRASVNDYFDIDSTIAQTYYIWVKDAAGNISELKSISSYMLTIIRGEGTNTTLKLDENLVSNMDQIVNMTVLSGTNVKLTVTQLDGYSKATILKDGQDISQIVCQQYISAPLTLESRAIKNVITVNLRQDDELYSNSGMKISLYQNGEEKYTTICTNGSQAIFEGVITGTYDVYAGKDSLNKTTVVDTGLDVEVGEEPNNSPK